MSKMKREWMGVESSERMDYEGGYDSQRSSSLVDAEGGPDEIAEDSHTQRDQLLHAEAVGKTGDLESGAGNSQTAVNSDDKSKSKDNNQSTPKDGGDGAK